MKTITITLHLTDEEFELLENLARTECFTSLEDFLLFCMIDATGQVRERVEREMDEAPHRPPAESFW